MNGTLVPSAPRHDYWLLLISIVLFSAGIVELTTFWTRKSSLIPIRGTLHSADTKVTSDMIAHWKDTFSGKEIYRSQKIDLVFSLNETPTVFIIEKSIGSKHNDEKYSRVVKGLREADSITVWIHADELNASTPTVFKIDTNKSQGLLKVNDLLLPRIPLLAGLWLGSILSLSFFFLLRSIKATKLRRQPK